MEKEYAEGVEMSIIKSIKTCLITITILILGMNHISALSNLELANKYYDADDYQNAAEFFNKTIFEERIYNARIFYRYAYTMEQLDSPKKLYLPFYSAAAYLFEKTNNTNEKYYSYAIAKEEKLGLSHKKYSDETIEKLLNGERVINQNIIVAKLKEIPEETADFLLILLCVFVVVIYIVGRIFSKNTECVIFSSKKEIFLLFAPLIILFILTSGDSDNKEIWEFLFPCSLVISFCFAVFFSIRNNINTKCPVLYIIISLLTKIGLFFIAPIVLLFTLFAFSPEKKDRRFRDGTRNNQRSKNIALLMLVLAGLIYSLIKTPSRRIEEQRY